MTNETMSLNGGLIEYALQRGRLQDGPAPAGRKVFFLDENGRTDQLREAKRHFVKGQELTVKEIYVGNYVSYVEFVEVPGEQFNTVMFADELPYKPTDHFIAVPKFELVESDEIDDYDEHVANRDRKLDQENKYRDEFNDPDLPF